MSSVNADLRYSRQALLAQLGPQGQARLRQSCVAVMGCGALGSTLATLLCRAGVGHLVLVDRDVVELSNLPRQTLYDEQDVAQAVPKAVAAQRHLAIVNSQAVLDAQVMDIAPHNVLTLLKGVDLVVDGTDNLETRYLLNDACLTTGTPWIYGGAVGTSGICCGFVPGRGPCLRCLFPELAPPGILPTCDTMGVLNTAPAIVGALQATEAMRLLVQPESWSATLVTIDLWPPSFRTFAVPRDPRCPACGLGRREFLDRQGVSEVARLCGRNAVQVTPANDLGVALSTLAQALQAQFAVELSPERLRFAVGALDVVVFADGRALVRGTTDPRVAKAIYAKYIGT